MCMHTSVVLIWAALFFSCFNLANALNVLVPDSLAKYVDSATVAKAFSKFESEEGAQLKWNMKAIEERIEEEFTKLEKSATITSEHVTERFQKLAEDIESTHYFTAKWDKVLDRIILKSDAERFGKYINAFYFLGHLSEIPKEQVATTIEEEIDRLGKMGMKDEKITTNEMNKYFEELPENIKDFRTISNSRYRELAGDVSNVLKKNPSKWPIVWIVCQFVAGTLITAGIFAGIYGLSHNWWT